MEFNEKLQKLRKEQKLTQEELAEKLFVSRTAISKWESGRGYPSIDSLKVDREILSLGGLYIVVIGLYLFFENVIINFRPIIMPDNTHPEASFPSSHTMLVCVIMGSAAMLINRYIRNKPLNRILRAVCYVIIGVTVVGRLIAGVHWFTDILGGILISVTLLSLYEEVISHGK